MSKFEGGPGAFRAANPDLSLDELTDRYLREASAQDLRVIVRDAFRNLERSHTRAIESSVSEDLRRLMSQPVPRRRPVTDEQREFITRLGARLYRFEGEAKRLDLMTKQEHQQRITLLKIQRDGISRSITIHETAISVIDAHGVTCLADLVEVPVLAEAA